MNYQQRLIRHLATYRVTILGVASPGVFRYRGKDVPKDHILPVDQKWDNILPAVRDQVRLYVERKQHITLHRYFHHLNSSQAFALNIFVPYFEGGPAAASALLRLLGSDGALTSWDVETIPVVEEESNIDVTWTTSTGIQTICEVKLSEAEFGTAVSDENHLAKLRDTYSPLLAQHLPQSYLQPTEFCSHYQILRNVWHMLRLANGRLVFLLPRDNTKLWSFLQQALNGFSRLLLMRISAIAIEDVVAGLCASSDSANALREHAEGLRAKYVDFQ